MGWLAGRGAAHVDGPLGLTFSRGAIGGLADNFRKRFYGTLIAACFIAAS